MAISQLQQLRQVLFTYTLTDSRFIDLNGLDTSLLQINHLVTEGEGELFGLEFARNVGTGEGPVEDGNRAGQHSLHRLLRDTLRVAAPLDSNRVGTADVGNDDGGADISGAVALNPTVLGKYEPSKMFTEVLDHVVPLGFAVDEKIKTDFLLEGNNGLDFLLDESLVLLFGELILSQFSTSGANLLGLGEGSNGGSGKLGQVQLLLLDLLANSEWTLPLQHGRDDGSNPLADSVIGGTLELTSLGDRSPVGLESLGDGRVLGSGKNSGNDMNLGSLLESEREPILLLGGQFLLRSESDGGVKERRRGGGDDTVTTNGIDGSLTGLDGSGEVGLPDVTAGNKTKRKDEGSGLDGGDGGLKLGRGTVEVNVETSNGEFYSEVDVGIETTKVGGQEDLGGDGGEFGVGGAELTLKLEASIENEDRLVNLNPLSTGSLELSQELLVEREDLGEEGDGSKVGRGVLARLAQPQVGNRA